MQLWPGSVDSPWGQLGQEDHGHPGLCFRGPRAGWNQYEAGSLQLIWAPPLTTMRSSRVGVLTGVR